MVILSRHDHVHEVGPIISHSSLTLGDKGWADKIIDVVDGSSRLLFSPFME